MRNYRSHAPYRGQLFADDQSLFRLPSCCNLGFELVVRQFRRFGKFVLTNEAKR